MNPLLKWSAIAAGALLVLAGGATLLVRTLVDEEQLKASLLELANSKIDGSLAIDGGLKVSLWPTLALAAEDVHLRTPAGASEDFAAAQELRLGVALLPLLREELQVRELVIEGLALNAACDAQGACNWAGLAGKESNAQEPAPAPADVATGAAAAPMLLNIARVRIRDSTLAFTDAKAGTRYELADISLDGEGINMAGTPFRLDGGALARLGTERRELKIALGADIDADRAAGTVTLASGTLTLTPAAGPALALELPAALIDLNAHTLDAAALKVMGSGIDLEAALNANWSNPEAPAANGTLDLKKLDLPALLATVGASLPPALNAEPLADIALASTFSYAGESLALNGLKLRAGRFIGEGEVRLGLGGQTRIDADFSSPELDLDYFLPPLEIPPGNAEEPAPLAAGANGALPEAQGLAALLTVDGAITARLGRLKRGKLELGDIDAALKLARGSARLQKLGATLYGGTLSATGTLAASAGAGSMQLDARLAAVDLKSLLVTLADMEQLEGRVNGSLSLNAQGADPATWKNTLSGPVTLGIADPVLRDISVEEVICKAAAQLNQEPLTARFEPLTRFRQLDAALDFNAGVGTLRQLNATVPNMTLRGEGRIDLPRERLEIQLNTRITDDLATRDPACRMTKKMLAVEWPVTCKGRFDEEPKKWCGIDKDDLAKIATQLATEKVQDKLMRKLGDFFNRD